MFLNWLSDPKLKIRKTHWTTELDFVGGLKPYLKDCIAGIMDSLPQLKLTICRVIALVEIHCFSNFFHEGTRESRFKRLQWRKFGETNRLHLKVS
jgi:hypothetical protein